MQRQHSIRSYYSTSPARNDRKSSSYTEMLQHSRPRPNPLTTFEPAVPISLEPPSEVFGTDTPPEKVPRSRFCSDGHATAQPSSSILQKLVKETGSHKRSETNNDPSFFQNSSELNYSQVLSKLGKPLQCISEENPSKLNNCDKGSQHYNSIPEILGPETPAMRPRVPRMKRIQEDYSDLDSKNDHLLLDFNKRLKSVEGSQTEEKIFSRISDHAVSRFEWLSPSQIRDVNRRSPDDAFYDKRTLYIPPDALEKMSASQKQYWSIKCQYMDIVLFFKVGKFYELYELDAEIGHKELDWKMTYSGVGKCRQVGISELGIDDAVQKLTARGYKVGRIEQTETSAQAKSRGASAVIQRKLVNVYTPSTAVDGNMGPSAIHLLVLKVETCSQGSGSAHYGFSFLDYAALKFYVGHVRDDASCTTLGALLMQVSPKEVIYESSGLSNEAYKALEKYSFAGSSATQLSPVPPGTLFIGGPEVRKLIESNGYFQRSSYSWCAKLADVMNNDVVLCALGGLVRHLTRLKMDDALNNGDIFPYEVYRKCLRMDGQTMLNLEIFCNNYDGSSSGTLYKYLDNCITSSGKRLLRNWICHPLMSMREINDRLNVVDGLMKHEEIASVIAQYLRRLPDLERLLGRVKASLGSAASLLPVVGVKMLKQRVKVVGCLIKGLRIGLDLLIFLQREDQGIISQSPVLNLPTLSGGNGLDELLIQLDAAVDNDFPDYQDHDVKESDAEILAILIDHFAEKVIQWSLIIEALSCIDVLRSFVVTANSFRSMCRPVIVPADSNYKFSSQEENRQSILMIKGMWHPYAVRENGDDLVPNDVCLGRDAKGDCPRALLLTGPNMGGKSTLLRATCLAVLLAQLGCYVPGEMCVMSPVDIIFTRLGATDRIMSGESTFFVECMETASILQHSTQDSLVILDELGRGTSTFDGYAIAYAVFRHLLEKVYCRLLFATHYHPLTKEFASHPHVKLQHMSCAFKSKAGSSTAGEEELVFLYKLASGACPDSYGLQVALMAGIPNQVVESASSASKMMKKLVANNFRSSEERAEFSSLHEDWLKILLAVSVDSSCALDEDTSDTLLLLWHELKSFYSSRKRKN